MKIRQGYAWGVDTKLLRKYISQGVSIVHQLFPEAG